MSDLQTLGGFATVAAVVGLIWHCPILKPYFGWRLPRRGEWFQ